MVDIPILCAFRDQVILPQPLKHLLFVGTKGTIFITSSHPRSLPPCLQPSLPLTVAASVAASRPLAESVYKSPGFAPITFCEGAMLCIGTDCRRLVADYQGSPRMSHVCGRTFRLLRYHNLVITDGGVLKFFNWRPKQKKPSNSKMGRLCKTLEAVSLGRLQNLLPGAPRGSCKTNSVAGRCFGEEGGGLHHACAMCTAQEETH